MPSEYSPLTEILLYTRRYVIHLPVCNLHRGSFYHFLKMMTENFTSRKLLCIKVTPDLHLTYSKNGGNLGLVLKMKNTACRSISVLLTKHVKYTYLYLFKFVLYSIVAFKEN